MSPFAADSLVSAGLLITIKVTVLLGLAALLQVRLQRRASAATRHLVWTLAVVGALLLPAASVLLPQWTVAVPVAPAPGAPDPIETNADAPSPMPAPAPVAETSPEPAPAMPASDDVPWSIAALAIYAVGALVMMVRLVVQRVILRRWARGAADVQDGRWGHLLTECSARLRVGRPVRLLRSCAHTVPLAFGMRRPSIVIPAAADTWADDRRRAVILHELAHVARGDCLTQTLAAAACAMYWFHPAAWWVSRRMRIERELACDDRVIAAGTPARAYASHLLEIAYSLGRHPVPALAVGMARARQLEGRLLAALDDTRNRRVPAFRLRAATAAAAGVVLCVLAAAAPAVVGAPAEDGALSMPAGAFGVRGHSQIASGGGDAAAPTNAPSSASTSRIMAQENLPGTWEIRPTNEPGRVRLRIKEVNSSSESTVPLERLEGLTAAQLSGAGGPMQFRLRRDAGTFTFEGVLRQGVGAGTFSFTPDPKFPDEMARRGFSRPTAREQYQMARHDIGFAFLEELNTQGYAKAQTADIVRAGQHGVDATYLRDMGALGYRLGSLQPLIELRDHGVTPGYVRALAELGYKDLPADEIRRARDHGITPEYVGGMREAGYGSLPMDQLVKARDHGVTEEYVGGMREAGYGSLSMDQLVKARDHGVTEEYVRAMRDAGYGSLPLDTLVKARDHGVTAEYASEMRQLGFAVSLDELVRARDHGVTPAFARAMVALGYKDLALAALVRLRDHGVTPEYAKDMKALGYDQLSPDDLVTLRDHGLTADRIRAANARAGTRLPVDMLKSLARGGGK